MITEELMKLMTDPPQWSGHIFDGSDTHVRYSCEEVKRVRAGAGADELLAMETAARAATKKRAP